MIVSRRRVCKAVALGLGGLAVGCAGGDEPGAPAGGAPAAERPLFARFAEARGEVFTAASGAALTLIDVARRRGRALAGAAAVEDAGPFRLVFSADAGGPALGQGTVRIAHPVVGSIDLFLVPLPQPPARIGSASVSRPALVAGSRFLALFQGA